MRMSTSAEPIPTINCRLFLINCNLSLPLISPDEGIEDPATVPVGMFDAQPAVLMFEDFKRNSLFNAEKDFIFGARSGADVAKVLFSDDRRYIANQSFVHPASVILKIPEIIP